MGYADFGWGDYVSVAEKRRRAEKKVAELKKQGRALAPVSIAGRTIARSFWGQSWCKNLERYGDFASRLPRGRSYVRNGSVIDLRIAKGEVAAMVCGSELYQVRITVSPVAARRWQAICQDCAGTIDSLVELLQGRLAKSVMDRVCREGDGLFPAPGEIKLSCSCRDWAEMCKHVAATLYGVGARLDEKPQLLFTLRGVDESELLARAGRDLPLKRAAPSAAKLLDGGNVAALFGLEMAEASNNLGSAASKRRRASRTRKKDKTLAEERTAVPKKTNRGTRASSGPKGAAVVGPQKKRGQRRPQRSA